MSEHKKTAVTTTATTDTPDSVSLHFEEHATEAKDTILFKDSFFFGDNDHSAAGPFLTTNQFIGWVFLGPYCTVRRPWRVALAWWLLKGYRPKPIRAETK